MLGSAARGLSAQRRQRFGLDALVDLELIVHRRTQAESLASLRT